MKLNKHYIICAAIGIGASLVGASSFWAAGYHAAQSSVYNMALRAELEIAHGNMDMIVAAKQNTDIMAIVGRRSDYLQYAIEHPGTYSAPAIVPDQHVFDKELAELRKRYPEAPKTPVINIPKLADPCAGVIDHGTNNTISVNGRPCPSNGKK